MTELKTFRKINNLTQSDVGDYLGIKKAFISSIENGKARLPKDKITKLINNDRGWDTSMLPRQKEASIQANDQTNPEIIRLIKIIEEQNHTIAILAEHIAKQ